MKSSNECLFCKGPLNTESGLASLHIDTILYKEESGVPKRVSETFKFGRLKNGRYLCPIGCKANPKDEKAATNIIKNNGRHTICHQNIWRYIT